MPIPRADLARASLLVLAAVAAVARAPARADEPEETFWSDVARPNRGRYELLVASATELLEGRNARAATPLLDEAVLLEPRRPAAWYLLGMARYREGRWEGCAEALDRLASLDPAYAPPVARTEYAASPLPVDEIRGACLALAGRLDDAVAQFRRMLAAAPSTTSLDSLHLNLGDCYHALGRLDEAITEYLAGMSMSPRNSLLHYGLAVAYDRDEQGSRAHESMLRALERDPQLVELGSANTYFVPPEDRSYYFGLAHQVASEEDRSRRALATSFFRHYASVVPLGPWTPRARAHLLELGSAALDERDVLITPVDAPEAALLRRRVAAALPELQRCLEGHPHVAVRAAMTFPAAARRRPPEAGALSTSSSGPQVSPGQVNECIEQTLRGVRLAPTRMMRAQVVLISR